MTIETISAGVSDYETAETLSGWCSRELAEASRDAAPTGAVLAWRMGGVWLHVPASEADSYRRQGLDVRTVYVDDTSEVDAAEIGEVI